MAIIAKQNEQLPTVSSAPKNKPQRNDIRIGGITLENKRIVIALTKIYGVGKATSIRICEELHIYEDKRPSELSEEEIMALREYVRDNPLLPIESDLRKQIISNIKHKIDIHCYEGRRHQLKLPVRGQNTKRNARTRKGKKSSPIANKKKITK